MIVKFKFVCIDTSIEINEISIFKKKILNIPLQLKYNGFMGVLFH